MLKKKKKMAGQAFLKWGIVTNSLEKYTSLFTVQKPSFQGEDIAQW
jgi:hypothetical protein